MDPSTTRTNGSSSPRSALCHHSMKVSAPCSGPHSKSISGQCTATLGSPGRAPSTISSMLGWVAAVSATESPSQPSPPFIQRMCTTGSSSACVMERHPSVGSPRRRRNATRPGPDGTWGRMRVRSRRAPRRAGLARRLAHRSSVDHQPGAWPSEGSRRFHQRIPAPARVQDTRVDSLDISVRSPGSQWLGCPRTLMPKVPALRRPDCNADRPQEKRRWTGQTTRSATTSRSSLSWLCRRRSPPGRRRSPTSATSSAAAWPSRPCPSRTTAR